MSHDEQVEESVRAGLAKLSRLIEDDEVVIFAKDEARALQEVARWWLALKGTGKVGGALFSGLKWMLAMIAMIAAVKAGVLDYLAEALGK